MFLKCMVLKMYCFIELNIPNKEMFPELFITIKQINPCLSTKLLVFSTEWDLCTDICSAVLLHSKTNYSVQLECL